MPVRAPTTKTVISNSVHLFDPRLGHLISRLATATQRAHPLIDHVTYPPQAGLPEHKLQYKPPPDFVQPEFSCDATPHH